MRSRDPRNQSPCLEFDSLSSCQFYAFAAAQLGSPFFRELTATLGSRCPMFRDSFMVSCSEVETSNKEFSGPHTRCMNTSGFCWLTHSPPFVVPEGSEPCLQVPTTESPSFSSTRHILLAKFHFTLCSYISLGLASCLFLSFLRQKFSINYHLALTCYISYLHHPLRVPRLPMWGWKPNGRPPSIWLHHSAGWKRTTHRQDLKTRQLAGEQKSAGKQIYKTLHTVY